MIRILCVALVLLLLVPVVVVAQEQFSCTLTWAIVLNRISLGDGCRIVTSKCGTHDFQGWLAWRCGVLDIGSNVFCCYRAPWVPLVVRGY